ncbi:daunorubicin resistance protein DrrA family ABC transporter ATP-binding protein [Actinocatenispora thailandica]|uniref:Daunorubicin resistance protein DrrA family ABC transporter ATP-binding protein n=1 Tax=Actinocatenispora thailandica TaxID=227318 RepID=A0A7R7DNT8_9ACTN|nr:ATP-binding cassette domain-containing protein [Actinocatenispora thailandica]BCJ35022.1 daunorubicin resistance protein DrrA family ABC transporter ATP-binding protein [Actinocatenispora thailandica]
MRYAIEAEGLVKRFGATTALAGVDLAAPAGRVLGLLGPNGAGKTTAVRVLATLIRPDGGLARVSGFDVVHQAHRVRQLVALTGQYAALDEGLTGVQNLILVGRLLGLSRRDARARAAALLARFGLSDAGGRRAKTYSGGMRRRLDLAVSLVGRPSVLYLDEPTTGLDPHSRNELWSIVRGLVADGATVLLTTQYMDEADQLADDIVVVDRGTVIATGTPDELKTRTGGQTLEIRPTDPSRVDEAAGIVAALTGVPPVAEGGRLSAPVSDPALPAAVLRRLDDAAITVTELALRLPSLDDVFLSLTGHRAEAPGGSVAETVSGRV